MMTPKKYEAFEFCPHPTVENEKAFTLVMPSKKRNMENRKYFHEIEYCKGVARPESHMDGVEYISCNICGECIKYKVTDTKSNKLRATNSFMNSHLTSKHGINVSDNLPFCFNIIFLSILNIPISFHLK